MANADLFDEISRRVSSALPPGVRDLHDEIERNLKAGLQGAFNRLDLVSREEFDVQQAVLLRTRERLEALEARVAELEAALQSTNPGPDTTQ